MFITSSLKMITTIVVSTATVFGISAIAYYFWPKQPPPPKEVIKYIRLVTVGTQTDPYQPRLEMFENSSWNTDNFGDDELSDISIETVKVFEMPE